MTTDLHESAAHAGPHAHHWLIDAPDGPSSAGRCKVCGAERTFANSTEAATWTGEATEDLDLARLRRTIGRSRPLSTLADEAA